MNVKNYIGPVYRNDIDKLGACISANSLDIQASDWIIPFFETAKNIYGLEGSVPCSQTIANSRAIHMGGTYTQSL